ncbi:MAG: hypothetical protein GY953_02835 [bacterium]|nr:hypothetical protein [bacterium]
MNRRFAILGWVVMAMFVVGLVYAGVRIYSASPEMCAVCHRHVHTETSTVAEADGERLTLCCPTCIRMLRKTRGVELTVVELTDHDTAEPLHPSEAWVVTGSAINHCLRSRAQLDDQKQTIPMGFDRCAPSIIAFANRAAAEAFQGQHGGEISRFGE